MSASVRSIEQQSITDTLPLQAVPSAQTNSRLHLVETESQIQIHTASFRGSFSVVLSEAIRTAGFGRRVLISQFLKGGVNQGPNNGINLCGRQVNCIRPNLPFCITTNKSKLNHQEDIQKAISDIWETTKQKLLNKSIDRLVLDEIGLAVKFGFIEEDELISTLSNRPSSTDVILTGPSIPKGIILMANQVTELR